MFNKMQEALYYKIEGDYIRCELCPKNCTINEGRHGFCRVRKNIKGRLYTGNYASCTACALDPIEKKPLYHFYPGSSILSVGTWGCNFSCKFCQNWQIAQGKPEGTEIMPQALVEIAKKQGDHNIGIAFTYSEPTVWYEYIYDTARISKAAGLKNVLITNGFINPRPLMEILPYIDAMNIDVKAYNPRFYQEICAGQLDAVKMSVELAVKYCHVEITTLIVPELNDDMAELASLAKWLAGINKDIPLHFSRYFPNYNMELPATPIITLRRASSVAKEFLNYVYLGNIGSEGINTYCPDCNKLLIDRNKEIDYLSPRKTCPKCGKFIYLINE